MPFTAAIADQRFILDHVVGIGALAESPRFAAATSDVVDAVLEGAGDFAAGEWAPLLRAGDTVGAKWTPEGVVMPEGFAKAYRDYVEGGWARSAFPKARAAMACPSPSRLRCSKHWAAPIWRSRSPRPSPSARSRR